MNSRTSRPRSPTRQITLISAEVDRAIMPSSDDLPTPEPAKMPRRWPRPQGTSASRARTPRDTRSSIRGRDKRIGRRGLGRAPLRLRDRAEPVQRTAQTIERTPRQAHWTHRPSTAARRRSPARPGRCRSRRRAPSAACGRRGSRRPPRAPTGGRGRPRSCTPRRRTPRGRWPRRSDRSGRRRGRCGDGDPPRGSRSRPLDHVDRTDRVER